MTYLRKSAGLVLAAGLMVACGDSDIDTDSGIADAGTVDTGLGRRDASGADANTDPDSAVSIDAGTLSDAGQGDSGTPDDSGALSDAGAGNDGGTSMAVITAAAGGMVQVAGASVTVPPGAVAQDTTIEIREIPLGGLAALPDGFTAVTPAFALLPHGQAFSMPATITLSHSSTASPTQLGVQRLDDELDASWEGVTPASTNSSEIQLSVTTFSVIVGGLRAATGPSCAGLGPTDCNGGDCCASILIGGLTFPMGDPEGPIGFNWAPEHPVTISTFQLDTYEVSVGRFRRFVQQYNGTPPADGAGAHPLIPGSGWQAAWNAFMPANQTALEAQLICDSGQGGHPTWTDDASGVEDLPINCVNWLVGFAFCAWDGGRLPTEAEWEAAATGGDENRDYPWGSIIPTSGLNSTLAAFNKCYDGNCQDITLGDIARVGSFPAGTGRWGHHDLAGNMAEWVLDYQDSQWYAGGGSACVDCANLSNGASTERIIRGGHYQSVGARLVTFWRQSWAPTSPYIQIGLRCAR